MLKKIEEIMGSPLAMLTAILAGLKQSGISTEYPCDHICYRVATPERYAELKAKLLAISTLDAESIVNGRPICIFSLKKPLVFENWSIECIELPAPKAGASYIEGWEHAEFVTAMHLRFFMRNYPTVEFDTKALGKKINPELSLKISELYKAKFHEHHIKDVLEQEAVRLH